ncbi:MAG: guanylate kinase [Bacteroidales bacterium]|nr:guanylate kinase [Bacteroidales bacterium]
MTEGKAIIFSAPSGSGKTTIIRRLLTQLEHVQFSISATSRQPRSGERHGEDYYYLSQEEFQARVEAGDFAEWEEVYEGLRYGTLKSEIARIWAEGDTILFDVDVKGGLRLKEFFGDRALALFVMPPSISVLEQRLRGRATDDEHSIAKRLNRAEEELQMSPRFDHTIINDDLNRAVAEAADQIAQFLRSDAPKA